MRPLLALSRDLPLVAESGDKILLMVWSCLLSMLWVWGWSGGIGEEAEAYDLAINKST